MAESAIPRLVRLLGIVTHLEEHGEATFEDLARHFRVPVETIRADIDTLWVSGLPGYGTTDLLDFDGYAYDEGIARLTESLGLRQVRLAPGEAIALLGALSSIVASGAAPWAAQGALTALRTALADSQAVTVEHESSVDPEVARTLQEALEARLAVAITYVDAQDRRTERIIEPHQMISVDGKGYVECYCRRAGDRRTLRLDRIESAALTGEPAIEPRVPSEGFHLEPQYGATVSVRVDGRWAFEDLPGVEWTSDGDLMTARFGVANPDVIVARMLAVAPSLVSVAPAALREALAAGAERILAAAAETPH